MIRVLLVQFLQLCSEFSFCRTGCWWVSTCQSQQKPILIKEQSFNSSFLKSYPKTLMERSDHGTKWPDTLPSALPPQILSGQGISGFHTNKKNRLVHGQVYKQWIKANTRHLQHVQCRSVRCVFPRSVAIACFCPEFWLVHFLVCFVLTGQGVYFGCHSQR